MEPIMQPQPGVTMPQIECVCCGIVRRADAMYAAPAALSPAPATALSRAQGLCEACAREWGDATPCRAILSSTVLPLDGTYTVETVPFPATLAGIPHYVGHPATKALLEALGAVPAESKLFAGLEPGEWCLAVPLASNPRDAGAGWTPDTAVVAVTELTCRRLTRLA